MTTKINLFILLFILFITTPLQAQENAVSGSDQQTISLAGQWGIALDINDEGIHKKWFTGTLRDQITLPGTTDIAGFGIPDQSPWINYLQRKHKYIGVTWYQKKIVIPQYWNAYQVELLLERVKWQSRVWIDGKEAGAPQDGLVTSHMHTLGQLSPGEHILTVRVDNRMIHPIGDKGHNYTEQTESIWNGIVGQIALVRKNIITAKRIRLFPDYKKKTVTAEIDLYNPTGKEAAAELYLSLQDKQHLRIGQVKHKQQIGTDSLARIKITIPVDNIALWSEFQQPLYTAQGYISVQGQREQIVPVTFSFRDINTTSHKILINNIPTFIRGNQEALGYPPTGYPPTDVETWRKIFSIYKQYNLNQVRFHSSCPPEAAFQAADELGIYIMVELVWMTSINAKPDIRPISATMGIPQGLGNNDRSIDDFVYRETRRLLDQYGNHPSFCFFAFGNEMDNLNKEKIDRWVEEFKTDDPRRLYAGTTARMILPHDDFQDSHLVPGKGAVVNKAGNPSTLTNYDSAYYYSKVPVIAHELGQFPVYPVWSEIKKYDSTVFRFINLERSLALAKENQINHQDETFRKASGHLQQVLYKEEIERQFSSRYSAGFNLLQMNDYTGQGEALVGWLDAFYDSKGITTPALFSRFCNSVVALAAFPKRVFINTEQLPVEFKIANYKGSSLHTEWHWQLGKTGQPAIRSGKIRKQSVSNGTVTSVGKAVIDFPKINTAEVYTLRLYSKDSIIQNSWDFWVYPEKEINTVGSTIISTSIEETLTLAEKGNNVLFLAHKAGFASQKNFSAFVPVFWSTIFFPGAGTQTLGASVANTHPAMALFPSGEALDWQWQDLCNHSRGTVLDGEALSISPIVQPIDDFHNNKKLAAIYEIRYGNGRILICGYDLANELDIRPAARQLRSSLLHYMNSDKFDPQQTLSKSWLIHKYTPVEDKQEEKPGKTDASSEMIVKMPSETRFRKISAQKYEIISTTLALGTIRIKGADTTYPFTHELWINGRKATLTEDGAGWIKTTYFREDFEDKKLIIEFRPTKESKPFELKGIEMNPDANAS
ncbi:MULTISPECIES: sugar-binding domain-containing protein [unclassified Sphingobacterium]|uniref:sugar-binding domain-containing protein n=1 Tax=unclassified Sphingobacterium TaxID=2609468 RepID=UPI0025FD85B9|nr:MULTISPECIES: sugar-binding domain-containing protein [unclassified Sphingobacterium]